MAPMEQPEQDAGAPGRRRNWLRVALLTPVGVLAAVAVIGWALMRGAEPQLEGELLVQGSSEAG
ncbi:MAG: hypothetical protein EBQ88_00090, partial [Betaproteobacteria bacterium]|nr:hypothetical protein [Betaproteobacteria bacterium]